MLAASVWNLHLGSHVVYSFALFERVMEKTRFDVSRRRFVCGLSGVLGAAAWSSSGAALGWIAGGPPLSEALTGTDFDLEVGSLEVNFTGAKRIATAVNGQVPGPQLRWREGDTVTVRVKNRLAVPTSVHWHGVLVPADMDGVPGLSFAGIQIGRAHV